MNFFSIVFFKFFLISSFLFCKDLPLHLLKLPEGFTINIYAKDVPNARSMTLSDRETLFIGTRRGGKVYAVRDENGDKTEIIFTVSINRVEDLETIKEKLKSINTNVELSYIRGND